MLSSEFFSFLFLCSQNQLFSSTKTHLQCQVRSPGSASGGDRGKTRGAESEERAKKVERRKKSERGAIDGKKDARCLCLFLSLLLLALFVLPSVTRRQAESRGEGRARKEDPPPTWTALAAAARRRNSAVRSVAAALDDDETVANVDAPPAPNCAMVVCLSFASAAAAAVENAERQSEIGSKQERFPSPFTSNRESNR